MRACVWTNRNDNLTSVIRVRVYGIRIPGMELCTGQTLTADDLLSTAAIVRIVVMMGL